MVPPAMQRSSLGQFAPSGRTTTSRAFVLLDEEKLAAQTDGQRTSPERRTFLLFGPSGPILRAARACALTVAAETVALDAVCCALPRLVGPVFSSAAAAREALLLFIRDNHGTLCSNLLPAGEALPVDARSTRRLIRLGAAKTKASARMVLQGWVVVGPVRDAWTTREHQIRVKAASDRARYVTWKTQDASVRAHAHAVAAAVALSTPAGILEHVRIASEMSARPRGVRKLKRSRARLSGGRVVPRLLPSVRAARQYRQTAVDAPGLPRHWMLFVCRGVVHRLLYVRQSATKGRRQYSAEDGSIWFLLSSSAAACVPNSVAPGAADGDWRRMLHERGSWLTDGGDRRELVFGIEYDVAQAVRSTLELSVDTARDPIPRVSDAVLCVGGDGGSVGGRAVTLMFWTMQCRILGDGRSPLIPHLVLFSGEAAISLCRGIIGRAARAMLEEPLVVRRGPTELTVNIKRSLPLIGKLGDGARHRTHSPPRAHATSCGAAMPLVSVQILTRECFNVWSFVRMGFRWMISLIFSICRRLLLATQVPRVGRRIHGPPLCV